MTHPNEKHGWFGTAEYNIWGRIVQRCTNQRDKDFPRYGGRGIKVCDRWRDFKLFIEDMGPRPSKLHSIDRIDVSAGYSPDNCRWATPKQQARNTRRTIRLESGEALRDVLDSKGLSRETIKSRVARGLSLVESISKPVQHKAQRRGELYVFNGKGMSATELCRLVGISLSTFKARLKSGWSVDKAATTPVRKSSRPWVKA